MTSPAFFKNIPDYGAKSMLVWGSTLVALVPLLWLLLHEQINLVATLLIFLVLLVTTVISKPASICATLVYLFVMGDIRRLFGWVFGFPKLDPLLLVGPMISIVLAAPILMRLRLTDALSRSILALMIVMTLEIVNPRQGPVTVGLAGAMFYLVPLLWFWIGKAYGTDALLHAVLYKVVIPLGTLSALLGLYQTYVGFLPWESAWINSVKDHLTALNLGGGFIRSFGFSAAAAEYIYLLAIASAGSAAAFFSSKRVYGLLFPLLVSSLFLASSRSAIVKLLFALAVSWALSSKDGKGWVFRLSLALAVGVGAAVFSLSHLSVASGPAGQRTAAGASAQHQLHGLQHPLDSRYSTAGLHSQMFVSGLVQGFKYPIGYGLGSTTLAARKFGGDETASGSSEIDISDAFKSLGLVGGFLYLFTIAVVIRRAISFGRLAPKSLSLPVIGILATLGGFWIALGQYAICPLVWFLIGALARFGETSSRDNPLELAFNPDLRDARLKSELRTRS